MKTSFGTIYTLVLAGAGLLFAALAALAAAAYLTGATALIWIGMGLFMAAAMTMTSVYAQRANVQRRGRAS